MLLRCSRPQEVVPCASGSGKDGTVNDAGGMALPEWQKPAFQAILFVLSGLGGALGMHCTHLLRR